MRYLIQHGLDESALKYPDHPVIRFKGQSVSYTEMVTRSNQLAHFLLDQGIQRRDRIGVFLNKSVETVVSIYGIMKAGAVFVPLDPLSPTSRLETIAHDCGLRGIISQKNKAKILNELGGLGTPLEFVIGVALDTESNLRAYSWDDVSSFSSDLPSVKIVEDDLAYIMYTSGSTGAPKGMMHTHYSGMSYVRMSAKNYDVRHEDVLSNHSPLHFDMSTFDYFTGPHCGSTTVIIPETYTLFPANLSKLIQDEKMTIWYSVPFAVIQLLMRGLLEDRDLSSLRWIIYGGEPFPRVHLRDIMERLPNVKVSNNYGPAEVNQCSIYILPPPSEWEDDDAPVPIGHLIETAEGLVLDEDNSVLGVGEMGELVVRTPQMMRGYWGRPDLNEKVFYRREIFPEYTATYLRTGDLVKLRDDGMYDFFGRKDHQVKVRGYRVELAEIDNALASHDAVQEGSSYVIKNDDGDFLEVAVILHEGTILEEQALIGYLRGRVPTYAVPERAIFLDEFPRTRTGKIDRRALQEMATQDNM